MLIGPDGHLIIADLGLARSFGLHPANIDQIAARLDERPSPEEIAEDAKNPKCVTQRGCGTLEYMAPEVYRDAEYSFAVDVWAFGIIMYEMLLGKVSRVSLV